MKATASFIWQKIAQDAWKIFLHFHIKIRHIIWQTFFTWVSFQTCRCTEHGTTCANRKMRTDDLLMHHEYRTSSSYHAAPAHQGNKMLECWLATLNASSAIMSEEQINAARIGVICARVLQLLLTSCLQGSKGTAFNLFSNYSSLSRIHRTASLYQCPADCFQDILFEQAGNSHWNKFAFLQHIKWHICSVGAWKYLNWCQ